MMFSMFENDVFSDVYSHLITDSCDQILQLECTYISKTTLKDFLECAFHPKVLRIWERIFILELNFADQDGLLAGETSAERFDFFVREICKPENFFALCEKYPGLWENWQRELTTYTASLKRFVIRVTADIELIAKYFYDDPAVTEISRLSVIGDPHKGMQQTARVEYTTPEDLKRVLYYKPRNLTVDEGFFNFITWWNSKFSIDHHAPRVLKRGDYGWAEAITQRECETLAHVRDYYRRYGSLIALTHLFAATDLHMENIIACGEYPVIVDIETLFSCTLETEKHLSANYHLYASLLLPVQTAHDEIEISPLSARGKTQTNINILVNPQQRSSSLRMEGKKLVTDDCGSQLVFQGENVDFTRHCSQIIEGLRETLIFLAENRDQVLGIINKNMSTAQIRIVVQATEEYAKILHNIYHPDSLYKTETARNIRALADSSHDADLLEAEMIDLERGDIPYFQMPFDKPVLTTGLGRELETPVFQSPRQKLEYQFSRLTSAFIDQSVKDVEHAFLIYRTRNGETDVAQGPIYSALASISDKDWLDELARVVLDEMIDKAVLLEGNYSWRSISMTDEGILHAGLSETDLYQGVTGVALTFFVVGKRFSCARYLEFARILTEQIIRKADNIPSAGLGALTGTAGTLWAASVINADRLSWQLSLMDQALAKLALRLVTGTWEKYIDLDYVAGAAGTLSMLLRLHALYQNFPIAERIERLADFTFALVKDKAGSLLNEEETLLGFAHGTSGVSSSLAEYMTYFQKEDSAAIVLINSNIERETRYRSQKGWLRLGKGDTREVSWCNGTIGIGYSRMHCRPFMSAETYDTDMRIITARLGEKQTSHCLCHGMIGDYYFARALGLDGTEILHQIRNETEIHGIKTNAGLNGFEMVGALNGITSLFVGEAVLQNKL